MRAASDAAPARPPWWRRLRPPRRLSFTREVRLIVILSVGVGFAAINTGNNLLYLLLGWLLSFIIASGLLSEMTLKRLTVERRPPPRVFAGEPFLMEVVPRTPADRKGGHLARGREDGRLVLRESAQTPEEDMESLQDTGRHRYSNTNNLWVNLVALDAVLRERDGVLGLPIIVNRKTVDPGDKSTPEVFQLETAMGAAISVFEGAQALEVSRRRFAPVKTTNDLLVLRSDFYVLTPDAHVEPLPDREPGSILVDLDADYYKLIRDFDARFPAAPPSLRACERLVVHGDVTFGAGVVVRGAVEISAENGSRTIADGSVLEG